MSSTLNFTDVLVKQINLHYGTKLNRLKEQLNERRLVLVDVTESKSLTDDTCVLSIKIAGNAKENMSLPSVFNKIKGFNDIETIKDFNIHNNVDTDSTDVSVSSMNLVIGRCNVLTTTITYTANQINSVSIIEKLNDLLYGTAIPPSFTQLMYLQKTRFDDRTDIFGLLVSLFNKHNIVVARFSTGVDGIDHGIRYLRLGVLYLENERNAYMPGLFSIGNDNLSPTTICEEDTYHGGDIPKTLYDMPIDEVDLIYLETVWEGDDTDLDLDVLLNDLFIAVENQLEPMED